MAERGAEQQGGGNMLKSAKEWISATLFLIALFSLLVVLFTSPSYTAAPRLQQTTLTPEAYLPFIRKDPTPTPSPTPTLGVSDVRIEQVVYTGSPFDILEERVEFHNYGAPQDMTGWKLKDAE